MASSEKRPRGSALHSWKEIADYLGVTVRSAQRWEKTAGLPVRRLGRGRSARVVAFTHELDEWLASGGARNAASEAPPVPAEPTRKRRLWTAAAGLLAGAALLALALLRLLAPGDPHSWSLAGGTLRILDARGKVCWRKQLPELQSLRDPRDQPLVQLADIDGDGRREVLLDRVPANREQPSGALQCYEASGHLRWEYRYGAQKTFGGRTFEPDFGLRTVRPVQISGRAHLVTVANHRLWFPSQVSLLDARSGRLVEEYWHPGAIRELLVHDADRDGQDELVFAAINNPGDGLGHAALGVLKLPFSRARQTRARSGVSLPALTGGGEWAYVLFPVPDTNRVAGLLPIPEELAIDALGRIRVKLPLPEGGAAVYYLNGDLEVTECRFSDNFPALHDRYYRQGLLDHPLSARERKALCQVAPFTAAPDGNSPELRRFWQY